MPERIFTYYKEALELHQGKICQTPRMAIIYVTYACNFTCEGCLCRNFNNAKAFMTFEQFKDVASQLKKQGVESIELCGGGEPLLHPDIEKMICYVTDTLQMKIGIMSNGSMLNDSLSRIIATKANYFRTSFYEYKYHEVLEKVRRLIEIKKEVSGRLIIGAKFLVTDDNQDLVLSQLKEIVQIPGIDQISVKARRGYGEDNNYSSLEEEIGRINDERIHATLKKTYLKESCWMAPIHTLIDPYGDVYICCYYMDREAEHCIGNVFKKPFSEIWGSPEHIEKMRGIDTEKCNVFDCRWHIYNEKMSDLLNNDMLHQFC